MARISTKNQITIPVAVLEEVGLRAGEQVTIEPSGDGELRVRQSVGTVEDAFGALTGTYPAGYLAQLDAEDEHRHPVSLPDAYCLATAKHSGSAVASFDQKILKAAKHEGVAVA